MEVHLKHGEQLLGILRSYDIDFLWLNCGFQPTFAFKEYEPLFQEELRFLNADRMDEWEAACNRVEALVCDLLILKRAKILTSFCFHIQGDGVSSLLNKNAPKKNKLLDTRRKTATVLSRRLLRLGISLAGFRPVNAIAMLRLY
ncbi:MAG: hypothetical protein IPK58_24880 [Acidobacteria bacterium]|nr:hypothetical protein [Acidobacteriota bacterium]